MLLDTLSIDKLYVSLCDILGVNREYLDDYITSNHKKIVESCYDDNTVEFMDISDLCTCPSSNIKNIDSLIMHHITPRPNEESIWREGLYTLPNVLTKNTLLSSHLKKYGLTFSFCDNKVIMKKDDNLIDISRLSSSNLFVRFGGKGSLDDFNINGYLFVNEFNLDDIRGWIGSPEILKSLAEAFNNLHIADSYAEKCENNYYVSFSAPLDKIDITGFDANISLERKTKILVKYSINALAHTKVKNNRFYTMHNPIIMLKRSYNVPPCDIKKVWILNMPKYPKIIPIEQ